MNDTELAGLLCARLCHDLGSPIGAVVNGLDLIREIGPGAAGDELATLERSAHRAAALLRFHRLAFGAVRHADATLTRETLRASVGEVLADRRVTLDWAAPEGPALGAAQARLAALMLLAGRAMLGMGGTLALELPAGAALPLAVRVEGAQAAASPEQRHWLRADPGPGPDAPEIEFALLPAAAAAAGARLALREAEGRVELRALPA